MQFDFSFIAGRALRQCGERSETALEMAYGFKMSGALGGMSAGLKPLSHSALGISGRGEMMGEQLGLTLDEIREMLSQHRPNAGVQFLSPRAQ